MDDLGDEAYWSGRLLEQPAVGTGMICMLQILLSGMEAGGRYYIIGKTKGLTTSATSWSGLSQEALSRGGAPQRRRSGMWSPGLEKHDAQCAVWHQGQRKRAFPSSTAHGVELLVQATMKGAANTERSS